jgi:SAM-dependent methyltransferase
MHQCAACGFCFVAPMPTREVFAAMYDDSYTASPDAEQMSRVLAPVYLEKVHRHLPRELFRFLEIGGSYGFLAALVKREFGAEVTLLEPGARAVEAAGALGIEVIRGYAETYKAAAPFDVIFAAHVVEHVIDVAAFVSACAALLRPGGKLILITPNARSWKFTCFGDGWSWSAPGEHTHFLSTTATETLFPRCGFAKVEVFHDIPHRKHYPFFLTRLLSFALTRLIGRQSPANSSPVVEQAGQEAAAAPASQRWKHRLRRSGRVILWAEYLTLAALDRLMGRSRMDELMIVATRQ